MATDRGQYLWRKAKWPRRICLAIYYECCSELSWNSCVIINWVYSEIAGRRTSNKTSTRCWCTSVHGKVHISQSWALPGRQSQDDRTSKVTRQLGPKLDAEKSKHLILLHRLSINIIMGLCLMGLHRKGMGMEYHSNDWIYRALLI